MESGAYRLDLLGSYHFRLLCMELLELEADVPRGRWSSPGVAPATASVPEGLTLPDGTTLEGPTLVVSAWARRSDSKEAMLKRVGWRLLRALAREISDAGAPRSALVLTPGSATTEGLPSITYEAAPGIDLATLDGPAIGTILDANAELRFRMPSVLGLRDLADTVSGEIRERSTADLAGATSLARVFVPTAAYRRALDTVRRHGFAVLTGPPEMGKTAIARTISLAATTVGFEAHECVRPDDLWQRLARDRPQIFVADDAFGSTEYHPDAAERWALELDRILRALDERHWLIWTSRPAPLHAALRRIHREHGVERWPRPAEVAIDASDLGVAEKALILYRHATQRIEAARTAAIGRNAADLVRVHGWDIVDHPHFTPERIRRFVAHQLLGLTGEPDRDRVLDAVLDEIRRPTEAMAASLRALPAPHQALLVALLDTPPGLVSERELAAAARRHSNGGMPRAASELVDQLADHFLHVVPPANVTWVHPSWRDIVIDELALDPASRRSFLARCSIDGALLALSTSGGSRGDRLLPLLVCDADWDELAGRLRALTDDFDDREVERLLAGLDHALEHAAAPRELDELMALARETLERLRDRWDASRAAIPVAVLAAWFGLARRLPVAPPALGPTWSDLLPVDLDDRAEFVRFDDWTALVLLLREHAPDPLEAFGFPARQSTIIEDFGRKAAHGPIPPASDDIVDRILWRLERLTTPRLGVLRRLAARLELLDESTALTSSDSLDPDASPISGEEPAPARALVSAILRDL